MKTKKRKEINQNSFYKEYPKRTSGIYHCTKDFK